MLSRQSAKRALILLVTLVVLCTTSLASPSSSSSSSLTHASSHVDVPGAFGKKKKKKKVVVAEPSLARLKDIRGGAARAGGAKVSVKASSTKGSDTKKKQQPHQPKEVEVTISLGSGSGGTATIPNEIFNLVKSIVGAGVLGLPAGIAAFGDAPSALLPASALILIIGIVSGYCFSLIGRVCSYTHSKSYRQAWENTVGPNSVWLPVASTLLVPSCATLAYSMILADTFRNLLETIGFTTSRRNTLLGVTTLVLLPLCLLKNMSSLAPFSLLGIIGMAYTSVALTIRYLDGSYVTGSEGKFISDVKVQPTFGSRGASAVYSTKSFILICMLSTAYMAHYNAPKFLNELKDNTISRYNTVVSTSYLISIAIFIMVASMGFLTFGSACSGLVLNNYSNKDVLMSLSRVAVAVSIVFSFPLAFVGLRDGILDLFKVSSEKRTDTNLRYLTVTMLAVITTLALILNNLSFVLAFGGATWGNAVIYIYPTLMFRWAVKKMGDDASAGLKREVYLAMFCALLGVVMGVIGTTKAIQSISS